MEYCSWRTNSPFAKIAVQIMKLRPSTLLQRWVSLHPAYRQRSWTAANFFSNPYAKSVIELRANAGQLDPAPYFGLFTHVLLYGRKCPQLDCGRQLCAQAWLGPVVIQTFLRTWLVLVSLLLPRGLPGQIEGVSLQLPLAPCCWQSACSQTWWEFVCLKTR